MQILETASMLTVDQMAVRLKAMTEKMSQHEDYDIIASSHKAGPIRLAVLDSDIRRAPLAQDCTMTLIVNLSRQAL